MKIELKDFIIICDKELDYMPEIISTLENRTENILNFFGLDKLSKKKNVIIYSDRNKYKEHMLCYVDEFKDWMCGDTYGGDINLLVIDEAKKSKSHKNMTLDEFTKCILHEFVHSCEQEVNKTTEAISWYWEALATNLSGQDYNVNDLSLCDFDSLQNNFNETKYGYNYAFTIGKYMLENYPREKLLYYISKPQLLKNEANGIFASALRSQPAKIKSK